MFFFCDPLFPIFQGHKSSGLPGCSLGTLGKLCGWEGYFPFFAVIICDFCKRIRHPCIQQIIKDPHETVHSTQIHESCGFNHQKCAQYLDDTPWLIKVCRDASGHQNGGIISILFQSQLQPSFESHRCILRGVEHPDVQTCFFPELDDFSNSSAEIFCVFFPRR